MAGQSRVAPEVPVDGFFTPAFFDDPYPSYASWRQQSPLVRVRGERASYLVIGFDEVYSVLRNHDLFSSDLSRVAALRGRQRDESPDQLRLVLITDDPPRHTRFRGLVNRAFTPRRVRELEPFIGEVVARLLDRFPGGEVDVTAALTVPLPVTVIATLLGVPPERGEDFKRWSNALIASEREGRPDESRMATVMEMVEFLSGTLAERRSETAGDLITALAEAQIEGERLQDWEILGFSVLLLVAGNETTTNLIGNMLNLLATRPETWARLRADRSLVEPVIEESLRIDSPVQMLNRFALEDTELGGVALEAGAVLNVCYGAANRDAAAFREPDEFRLDRELSRHVAFGMGIHYCLGAPLARAEARIALNALLDRFERLEPGSAPAQRQHASHIVRGFQSLPLRFD